MRYDFGQTDKRPKYITLVENGDCVYRDGQCIAAGKVINPDESSITVTTNDLRLNELKSWLGEALGLNNPRVEPASADASFRRYFRVYCNGRTYIAMDAPPDREDCRPFLDVGRRLRESGLNAPAVLQQDLSLGYLLLDDLGSTQYLNALNADNVNALYGDALHALFRMQSGVPASGLRPYDRSLLRNEMDLFVDWFLQRHLRIDLDRPACAVIEETFAQLIDSALEQPRVFVHRDYHSRNLMVTDRDNPGILDFQDAVHGPVTYDLVSLLRDCYVAWPQTAIEGWMQSHYHRLQDAGMVQGELPVFRRWFDWMGLQRHLKAIGIFARLNHRDGKADYLKDIPRTFNYLVDVCQRYAALEPFGDLMQRLQIVERLKP